MTASSAYRSFTVAARCGLFVVAAALGFAQSGSDEIHSLQVRPNVYMLVGAGGNITALVGADGVLLVDTGLARNSDKVIAAVKKLSDKPVMYIVNTHIHADHTGGNEKIAATGSFPTGGNVAGDLADAGKGAEIFAHENVLERMSAAKAGVPVAAQPTETYHTEDLRLSPTFHFGEAVQLIHIPSAHTDGDSLVYFRRADVIATGDIFTPDGYPFIDLESGGNVNGVIAGLNKILDIAFPDFRLEGGTMIVPGHGRLCDIADVAYYRDMVTIVRDRVQDQIKKGKTLEQIKAAKLTIDYDPRYGTSPGSTDRFIEAIYKSLTQKK
jgi:cyclase